LSSDQCESVSVTIRTLGVSSQRSTRAQAASIESARGKMPCRVLKRMNPEITGQHNPRGSLALIAASHHGKTR
jgi:hypothetical protein